MWLKPTLIGQAERRNFGNVLVLPIRNECTRTRDNLVTNDENVFFAPSIKSLKTENVPYLEKFLVAGKNKNEQVS